MKQIGFAFGIRIVKSFSIEDKLGAIIDEILYSDKSEFNDKMFTDLQENHNTKVLFNRNGDGSRFTITPRDFIFDYNVQNSFDLEYKKYLDSYVEIITKRVFSNFKIKNIARFGFIIKATLDKENQLLQDISEVIKKHNKGINDGLSLRFNIVTKKPQKMKNGSISEDYDNEIVTYNKQNINNHFFSVDYQKYFKPELNIIEDATQNFATFCNNACDLFKKIYF